MGQQDYKTRPPYYEGVLFYNLYMRNYRVGQRIPEHYTAGLWEYNNEVEYRKCRGIIVIVSAELCYFDYILVIKQI